MYYPCSKNKGADQHCSYWEADLRLCFCLCRLLVFPCGGSINEVMEYIPVWEQPSTYRNGPWKVFPRQVLQDTTVFILILSA